MLVGTLPPLPMVPPVLPVLLDDSAPGDGTWLKNLQSSSWLASEGTLPAHITHSDREAGGLGWYERRPVPRSGSTGPGGGWRVTLDPEGSDRMGIGCEGGGRADGRRDGDDCEGEAGA